VQENFFTPPDPPARFVTVTGCDTSLPSAMTPWMARARLSDPPPGGAGTTMSMGLFG
jgi:hypothetical protein